MGDQQGPEQTTFADGLVTSLRAIELGLANTYTVSVAARFVVWLKTDCFAF